ncbi:MAG: O-antigen ligase family protein [Caulobacterales bacterium]
MTAHIARLPVAPREQAAPASLVEVLAFAGAVFLLLTYSQGWTRPVFGAGADAPESGVIRALYLPAYGVGAALIALTPWSVAKALVRQPFLIALIGVAAASVLWSVSPDQTSRRVFALLFTTLGGVVLAARFSWARLAEVTASSFAILALVCLFVGLFVPSIGRMTDIFPGAWRGVWDEKNTFGDNMTLGLFCCAAAALLNRPRAMLWWSAAALCLLLVAMSASKTSLVAALLGVAAMGFVASVRRGPASGVAATWTAAIGVALFAGVLLTASDAVLGLLGKDATLTGRTKIWAAVWRQIELRPWLGYGYAAVWDETGRWGPLAWITSDVGFRPRHAHNAWLEQWLNLGVPGLVAWAGFYLQTLTAAIVAVYRAKGAYLAFPVLVVFSLTSLTESIAVTYNDMRWVLFTALAVKLAWPDRTAAA